jgi:hypothetical protein
MTTHIQEFVELAIPHCLHNRLIDGGYVSRMSRPRSNLQRNFLFIRIVPKDLVRQEEVGQLKNTMISTGLEFSTFRLVA